VTAATWPEPSESKALLRGREPAVGIPDEEDCDAARLGRDLVANDLILDRARTAAGAIANALDAACDGGTLKQFNQRYRQRRQEAQALGRGFVPYTVARQRLENELALAAAGTSSVDFDRVFGSD
jgi:hypothetical protein